MIGSGSQKNPLHFFYFSTFQFIYLKIFYIEQRNVENLKSQVTGLIILPKNRRKQTLL